MNQELEARWLDLVQRLEFNTNAKKILWKPSTDDERIIANIGNVSVSLTRENATSLYNYTVEIFNEEGSVVDTFTDEMVNGSYTPLNNIFTFTSRQISGADAVIDQLLSSLPPDPDAIPF